MNVWAPSIPVQSNIVRKLHFMAMTIRLWYRALLITLLLTANPAWSQAELGKGIEAFSRGDYEAARQAWLPLAERGDSNAQNNLGVLYERGLGVDKDPIKAAGWYRQAAERGNASAQNNLGVCYEKGLGVVRDHKQATDWYRKGAMRGDLNAQNNLGVMYERGLGVAVSLPEAIKLYRAAADKGLAQAQNNLGVMYERGRGLAQDYKMAATWYRRAADQSHPAAQNNLGVLYGLGRGVKEDIVQANFWFTLAAAGGSANGATNRDSTARRLTPAQREQVDTLLADWQARQTGRRP
jgi:TPR repeat protein